jgi:predicted transcriptional regulator
MVSVWAPEYRFMLKRLRQARRDAGLTQAQVDRRLGWREAFVSKVESGALSGTVPTARPVPARSGEQASIRIDSESGSQGESL